MAPIILIYANCRNATAKGDFALAGNIAKELVDEIKTRQKFIDVILTSSQDNISRYEELYGSAINSRLNIEGRNVGLCSINQLDLVKNETVAFIEANRCAFAPAQLLKQALSPESKLLFIGAANQNVWDKSEQRILLESEYPAQQDGIYHYFNHQDMLISTTGIGADRIGLNTITNLTDLPVLTPMERKVVPSEPYGFVYLYSPGSTKSQQIITQYMKLTGFNHYCLVGNQYNTPQILDAYYADKTSCKPPLTRPPKFEWHQSLSNNVMRTLYNEASGVLVTTTGVMSTLEAMQDGKLPFYQDLECNKLFVESYLQAVQSATTPSNHLAKPMRELANLLFAAKPLSDVQMERIDQLLSTSVITEQLIKLNQTIIGQSNGAIAAKIMDFIQVPRYTQSQMQLNMACHFLKKSSGINPLSYDQALRCAAARGYLFELKVLLKYLPPNEISKQDNREKQFTALHWAVHLNQNNSALLLIAAGIDLNLRDKQGLTALHHAVIKCNATLISVLIQHGGSIILNNVPIKNSSASSLKKDNKIALERISEQNKSTTTPEINDGATGHPDNQRIEHYARLFTCQAAINEIRGKRKLKNLLAVSPTQEKNPRELDRSRSSCSVS